MQPGSSRSCCTVPASGSMRRDHHEGARVQRPSPRPRRGGRAGRAQRRVRRRDRRRRLRLRPRGPRGDDRRARRDRDADGRSSPATTRPRTRCARRRAGWDAATVLHGDSAEIDGIEFFGLGAGVPTTPWDWSFDLSDDEAEEHARAPAPPEPCSSSTRRRRATATGAPAATTSAATRSSTRSRGGGRRWRSAATSTRPGASARGSARPRSPTSGLTAPSSRSEGAMAYETPKLKRKVYEKEMERLQVELVRMVDWIKREGQRVALVFEGRDAAGKGGVIKRITENVSPRVVAGDRAAGADRARVDPVVLPALRPAPAGGGRARHLRPLLVQPRRGREGDGLLHARGAPALPPAGADLRADAGRRRDHPAQVLVLGLRGGAGATASRRGSTTR